MMDAQVEGRHVIEEDARDPERVERFLDALASMIAEAILDSQDKRDREYAALEAAAGAEMPVQDYVEDVHKAQGDYPIAAAAGNNALNA